MFVSKTVQRFSRRMDSSPPPSEATRAVAQALEILSKGKPSLVQAGLPARSTGVSLMLPLYNTDRS